MSRVRGLYAGPTLTCQDLWHPEMPDSVYMDVKGVKTASTVMLLARSYWLRLSLGELCIPYI